MIVPCSNLGFSNLSSLGEVIYLCVALNLVTDTLAGVTSNVAHLVSWVNSVILGRILRVSKSG